MACTLYCKVVLNQRFSNVINMYTKRHVKMKKKYYPVLRECIPLLFSRLNYPYNVNGGRELEFGVLKADENEASVLIKMELNLPPYMEKREIERSIKSFNLVPEFIKKVSVVRILFHQ